MLNAQSCCWYSSDVFFLFFFYNSAIIVLLFVIEDEHQQAVEGQDENAPVSHLLTGWPNVNDWAPLVKTWQRLTADQTSVWESDSSTQILRWYVSLGDALVLEALWPMQITNPRLLFTKNWTTFIGGVKHLTAKKPSISGLKEIEIQEQKQALLWQLSWCESSRDDEFTNFRPCSLERGGAILSYSNVHNIEWNRTFIIIITNTCVYVMISCQNGRYGKGMLGCLFKHTVNFFSVFVTWATYAHKLSSNYNKLYFFCFCWDDNVWWIIVKRCKVE